MASTQAKPKDDGDEDTRPSKVVHQVRIKGTFKKSDNELNGLTAISEELGDKPLEKFVVVGTVERHKREEQDGTTTVTARFVQIEPLDGEAADTARALMATAYTTRTGGRSGEQPDLFSEAHDVSPARVPPPDVAEPDGEDRPWPGDVDFQQPATAAQDADAANESQDGGNGPEEPAQPAARGRTGKR